MGSKNIIELSGGNFKSIASTADKLVIVDFWAPWCAPCRAVAPTLEKLAGEYPEKLIIGKLNIDENRETAISQNISSIPTMQVYKNGVLSQSIVGVQPYQTLKEIVEKYIP